MKHWSKALQLSALVLVLASANVWAQSTDPLQTCTPAQVRASERYWFAGNKIKIDFGVSGTTMPTPEVNTAPAAAPPVGSVAEGSTVITDANGTLQFWVGNGTVYDRDQRVMANGTGITGNLSAVQVVVAFAAPNVPGKYFIVSTTGAAANTPGTLLYSVVDMTANAGLGAVTATKNVSLPGISSNETLSAVPNHDGSGYWVLTTRFGTSELIAQQFNSNGPVGTPVTTTLSHAIGSNYGSIYFNKSLSQLAVVTGGGSNYAHILRFNAQTGVATETAGWALGTTGTTYAADFSPSGKYLYVSHIYPGRLWRYDVSSGDSALIKASEEYIGVTGGNNGGGHVRRGADDAMWIANLDTPSTLTRIPSPEAAVLADIGFVRGNIALPAGSGSVWGLPQTVAGCARAIAPDAVPAVAGPGTPLPVGTTQNLQVSVKNDGALGDVNTGKLSITLPAGVQVSGAVPAACTVVSPQLVECDLAAAGMGPIAPGATLGPLAFAVTVAAPGTYPINVAVQNINDEVGAALNNNTAATTIEAVAAPVLPPDAAPNFVAAPAAPFAVGATQQLQLQVSNAASAGAINDGLLTVTLPPNLRLTGSLSTACTTTAVPATAPQIIQCNLMGDWTKAIAPGGTAQGPLPLSVIASAAGSYQVDAEVSGVTGEVNLANNKASVTLTAIQSGQGAAPVPALGAASLALASLGLGGLGAYMARRRRKPASGSAAPQG